MVFNFKDVTAQESECRLSQMVLGSCLDRASPNTEKWEGKLGTLWSGWFTFP